VSAASNGGRLGVTDGARSSPECPDKNGRSYSIGSRCQACNPDRQDHEIQSARPDPRRGVFETLLVLDGRPVEVERHLSRLATSLGALYGHEPPRAAAAAIADGAAGLETGRLRLTLVPRDGAPVADVATAPIDRALVLPAWERAIALEPVDVPGGLGDHKWADRDLLAQLEPDPAARVALLCDSDGAVLEGSRGNVFLVRHGRLSTPPLDGRILPGVARAAAIEEARAAGIEIVEEPATLAALSAADEVFLTGSVRGLEPVRAVVGGREWAPGAVGPVLAERLRRRWSGPHAARRTGAGAATAG
jgi:para-aminobenzoate synthetase / 4-amino-4-deoxychorismate lyase